VIADPQPTTPAATSGMTPLARRVRGEYVEMPGLRLTASQAARLLSLPSNVAYDVLEELRHAAVLTRSADGMYSLNR
jgi:hypothetical protein